MLRAAMTRTKKTQRRKISKTAVRTRRQQRIESVRRTSNR